MGDSYEEKRSQILLLLRTKSIGVLAAIVALSLMVAACGGGDSSSSSGEATTATESEASQGSETGQEAETGQESAGGSAEEAAAAALKVAEEHKSVPKIGATKPIKGPIPSDKTVAYVNCGQPSCTIIGEGFKKSAELLGWKYEEVPVEPTPQSIQAGFEEVIRRKPDGVASVGLGPSLYPKQLAQLNEMGIPVFEAQGEVESGEEGVTYDPFPPAAANENMRVLANKVVADIGGEGEIATALLTEYPIVLQYTKAFEEEVEAKCPKCSLTQVEIPPSSLGKDAAGMMTDFLRANPEVKALYMSYDLMASGFEAALKNAGVERPLTYSWSIEGQGIEELKTGERTAAAPDPFNEVGWGLTDGFARIFSGEKAEEPAAEPIIWAEEFGNVPDQAEPFPPIIPEFEKQFEELWGLK